MIPTRNPFSTQDISPAVMPLVGDPDEIRKVTKTWQHAGWIGQIVGPHGAGKTSLTYALQAEVTDRFCNTRRLTIRKQAPRRRFPSPSRIEIGGGQWQSSVSRGSLLMIDGLENLNPINRCLMIRYCRSHQIGLLLTTHRRLAALPVIATVQPEIATLIGIVDYLMRDQSPEARAAIDRQTIQQAFVENQGDLRESLMSLYDVFERWARSGKCRIAPSRR